VADRNNSNDLREGNQIIQIGWGGGVFQGNVPRRGRHSFVRTGVKMGFAGGTGPELYFKEESDSAQRTQKNEQSRKR